MSSPRPMRADARRNRAALLDAAREAFLGGEVTVGVDEIARRAGVSVGTFYRHFETREAVVEAVFRQEIDEMCASPATLLAEHAPDEALRRFLMLLIDHHSGANAITAALKNVMATDLPVFDDARNRMSEALNQLLAEGVAAGLIRPDADGRPVLRAMGGVCGMSALDGWHRDALGIVTLLYDGLRFGAATPAGPHVGQPGAPPLPSRGGAARDRRSDD